MLHTTSKHYYYETPHAQFVLPTHTHTPSASLPPDTHAHAAGLGGGRKPRGKGAYDRTSNNRQPAEIQVDGKRKAKALSSSMVKDLFRSNFPLPGKSAEDAQYTEITW